MSVSSSPYLLVHSRTLAKSLFVVHGSDEFSRDSFTADRRSANKFVSDLAEIGSETVGSDPTAA